jgi:hypothetical protein
LDPPSLPILASLSVMALKAKALQFAVIELVSIASMWLDVIGYSCLDGESSVDSVGVHTQGM